MTYYTITTSFYSTKSIQNISLCQPDPESHRLFGKNYKKTFKTVPLQGPYLMPLDVQLESTSATRKLRDFGVYRAQSRNFDEADPILEPTVEISRLSTPVVTKTSGNGNIRFPKSFGNQNVPFLNNLSNSVHPTNLKPTMEISELPPSLFQSPGNGNSRFSETFTNQNQPFSQTSGNPVLLQRNQNVEISELPPLLTQNSGNGNPRFSQSFANQNQLFLQTSGNIESGQGNEDVDISKLPSQLAQTSGNGNLRFSQTLTNQNIPFSQTSDKENLSLSQTSGNGNVNEDYLIAAAKHYTFDRL